jgi:hypothetical protein
VPAVWLLLRAELRARWKAWLAISLLVGVAGGVVLTAAAGARRGASAFDRFATATRAPDVGVDASPRYFDAIERLPQVEAAAPIAFVLASPNPDLFSAQPVIGVAATDARLGTEVDRPDVVNGRLPAFARLREVAVNEAAAEVLAAGAGSSLRISSLSPEQVETLFTGEPVGEPAGPTVDVVVTGVIRTTHDLGRGLEPFVLFTPAFYRAYADRIGELGTTLEVRLRGGAAVLPAFKAAARRVVPESQDVSFDDTRLDVRRQVEDAIGVEVLALTLFAVVAGVAGLVAAGQALTRQVHLASGDDDTLRSLGLDRTGRFFAAVAPVVPVAAAGALVGVVVATAGSPSMPVGVAREAEIDPGVSIDVLVLAVGALALLILVVARAALTSWSTIRRVPGAGGVAGRASSVATAAARARVPPAAATGVRMALEPGRGRTAVPVGPALAAAAVGVAGIVATVIFAASLDRLVNLPSSYGWTWDVIVGVGEDEGHAADDRRAARLAARADVDGVATLAVGAVRLEGDTVQGYGLEPVEGSGFATVLAGRAPAAPDEALVGTDTLERIDAEIGSTVEAETPEGRRALRVVGRGVFPDLEAGDHDDFALLTRAGLGSVASDDAGGQILVRWANGVDEDAARERLAREELVQGPARPNELDNLAGVDVYPRFLAAFLVLLSVAAAGHALVTAVRRRRRDLAVLGTLGFVRRQVSATVAWQATTLAVVGLVVGVPLGLALGRWAWVLVADGLGVSTRVTVPLTVALVVPGALLVANLVAFVPGRIAARTRPAVVLRAE